MNDEDDFTMVDETFGVREASEASSDPEDADSLEPPFTVSPTPVQQALRSDYQHNSNNNNSNNHDGISKSSSRISKTREQLPVPAISLGDNPEPWLHRGTKGEGRQSAGRTSAVEWLAPSPTASGQDDLSIETEGAHQSNHAESVEAARDAQAPSMDGESNDNTRVTGWDRFRKKARAVMGVVPTGVITNLGSLAPSTPQPPTCAVDEPLAITQLQSEGVKLSVPKVTTASEISASTTTTTIEYKSVRVVPASPGDKIQEAVAMDVTGGDATTNRARAGISANKALRVCLSPGQCVLGTVVVPWSGEGSVTSVEDLEREVQQQLGMRHRMRLGDVQVRASDIVGFLFIFWKLMLASWRAWVPE